MAELAGRIAIEFDDGRELLDGEDVTDAIRSPEVSVAASRVSVHPEVREAMVAQQRALIDAGDYVAEGRDIGTVVSPGAPLKIFLTATDSERARRRAAQSGEAPEAVLAAQAARDARDRDRAHGALRPAQDSIELDTTGLDADEVVDRVVGARPRSGARADMTPHAADRRGRVPERGQVDPRQPARGWAGGCGPSRRPGSPATARPSPASGTEFAST